MNRRLPLLCSLLLAVGCAVPGASGDGVSSAAHHPDLRFIELATDQANTDPKLFTNYNPAGPSRWAQGWTWKLDLSGVGWNRATTVTAITPRHVVMADHFKRKVGAEAVFHDRKGRAHVRKIAKITSLRTAGVTCDIAVGLLDRPLPSSVRTYPLLTPREDYNESLSGAVALITEQDRRLFFHNVHAVAGNSLSFVFDPRIDESRRKRLIVGDSGNPAFVLTKGELALIETHSSGGSGAGPFYGSPAVVSTLRKVVKDLDPDYQLRTVALDSKVIADAKEGRALMAKPPTKTTRPTQARPRTPTRSTPPPGTPSKPRPRVVVPKKG